MSVKRASAQPVSAVRPAATPMSTRTTPEGGDILVRQEMGQTRPVYILETVPGRRQYFVHSREEAVSQALAFAKRSGVGVWLTDGDGHCTLLEDFRARELHERARFS